MNGEGKNGLVIKNLQKSFGGVKAVSDVYLDLTDGKSKVLIGPNGAGKSTLFNLITGELPLDEGEIFLFGEELSRMPVQARSRLGLARTYQICNLFKELTIEENLYLAIYEKAGKSPLTTFFKSWKGRRDIRTQIEGILEEVGLKGKGDTRVEDLSHGEQRQLEIGIAISTDPAVILFDEPMAGLSPSERVFISRIIRQLAREKMILVIEHDMDFALSITDHITVLNYGAIIAEGTVNDIKQNRDVRKIYKLE